jgi:hypothetical protein
MHSFGFVLALAFGLFLYWCRCRYRVWYGFLEIVAGCLLIYTAFFPGWPTLLWSGWTGPDWGEHLLRTVILIGGLYALVRGLDNIGALERWSRRRG